MNLGEFWMVFVFLGLVYRMLINNFLFFILICYCSISIFVVCKFEVVVKTKLILCFPNLKLVKVHNI